MKNPWLKKNPLLSMWLSGANSVAGSARGHATAAAKREITKAVRQSGSTSANPFLDLWLNPPKATPTRKRRKSR